MATTYYNVTDYGAIGNCTNVICSITSNTVSFSANQQLTVSNSIQLNDAGPLGTLGGVSTNHQGFYAYIKTVDGTGTNGTFDRPAENTTNGATGFVGYDNTAAFQACHNAATNTLPAQINITNGWFMCLVPTNYFGGTFQNGFTSVGAINEYGGGITWSGVGETQTILIGSGAWQVKGTDGFRGILFMNQGGANVMPETFQNMTMNGVAYGFTYPSGSGDNPMDTTDGKRWDTTHHAILYGNYFGGILVPTNVNLYNVCITNFEGENVISGVGTTNMFLTESNVQFGGSDASANNIQVPHYFTNVSDANQLEFFEYDDGGPPPQVVPSYETGIFLTNIYVGWALQGGISNGVNPLLIITNQHTYTLGFTILVSAWTNLLVTGGTMYGADCFNFSSDGGESGGAWNGGATITNINFMNSYYVLSVGDEAGPTAHVIIENCTWTNTGENNQFVSNGGQSTNIFLYSDTIVNPLGIGGSPLIDSRTSLGQWVFDDVSDNFISLQYPIVLGVTNVMTYAAGRFQSVLPVNSGDSFVEDNLHPLKVPIGATRLTTNQSTTLSVEYYPNNSSYPYTALITIAPNGNVLTYWNQYTYLYQTNANIYPIYPPGQLYIFKTGK